MSDCQFTANASTAYGKRRKWWIENRGDIAQDEVIDANCGQSLCFAPEHAFLRPKIVRNTWARLYGHVAEQLLNLDPGANVGVVVPDGISPDEYAVQMRSFLVTNKRMLWWRWAVRVGDAANY